MALILFKTSQLIALLLLVYVPELLGLRKDMVLYVFIALPLLVIFAECFKLFTSICYPSHKTKAGPRVSKNGKYILRLNFNGCSRRVTIDDRLPASTTSRSLHVIDRNNPQLLWPALVEKAYLKVRGGYDFPGSNSGTDLWVLSGWIPEQIFLRRFVELCLQRIHLT